jgi:hypothetical protein
MGLFYGVKAIIVKGLKGPEAQNRASFIVPFELGAKYESTGLKSADAFIAAYTEWVGADVVVTENRHLVTRRIDLPFRILQAEECLRLLTGNK